MDVGVVTFATDLGLPPGQLAAAVEDAGLDGLFVTEHTHLPLHRTPAPWGGELGVHYGRTFDPLVALGIASERTHRITLGTAICLLAQHDPIAMAKAAATVDHLSAGRLELGVGFGWCREEAEDHGVDFPRRHALVRDHVGAMRALWRPTPTGYDGAHVRFGPAEAHPKPRTDSGPPVLIGCGLTPRTLPHLVGWADGWMPSDRPALLDEVSELRGRLREAGRDPRTFRLTVLGPLDVPGRLTELETAGVSNVLHWLPPSPPEAVLAELERLRR